MSNVPLRLASPEETPPTAEPEPIQPAPLVAPLLFDKADLARELRTSTKTIDRLDAAGKLPPPLRISGRKRWPREEIVRWIAAGAPNRRDWARFKRRE